jgi:hypothetical protein
MSALQLVKRIITVTLMAVAFFVLLSVIRVEATPIRPDVRKVLERPMQSPADFATARAGWDGPETPSGVLNVTYEQLGPAATARQVHQSLVAAFIPDYRALAAITLVIMLLRRININQRKTVLTQLPTPNRTIEAERTPVPISETQAKAS